jgi:lysophospholipase L1-like esterase
MKQSEDTRSLGRLGTFFARVAVVFASCLVTLLFCELLVRVVAPTETLTRFNEDYQGLKGVRAGIHGFHQIPDTFRKTYSTSTQRFRGPQMFSPQPPPGTLRIAVLGDSFTFGWGANDDETYPAVLERILTKRMGPVEIINAGALGDGTGDEALWYDAWVSAFNPKLVILTVVPNDTDDDLARTLFTVDSAGEAHPLSPQQLQGYQHSQRGFARLIQSIPGYEFLGEHSQLLSLFRRIVSLKIRTRRISQWQEGQTTQAFKNVGLPLLGAEVAWLNKRVQQSGAKLVVTFVPFRDTIYSDPHAPKPVLDKPAEMIAVLTKVCAAQRIPFLDMTPEFHAEAASDKLPLYYMTKYDSHPTPEGYRLMAENLASFLSRELHEPAQAQR